MRDVIASIHSAAAGKAGNQDSTLLWVPFDVGRIRWAAAVADGVSCSFYAKCGSRLACHAALAVLLGLQERGDKVLRPLPSCVKMFQRIGRRIAECPEAFRPAGCSQSIWRRVVRDGTLFQTTLLVVWQEGRRLHVDGIGDGGFILVYRPDAHPMTFFPSSSGPVNCLGPKTLLDDRDYGHEFSQWNTLAAFTDGVSDAISQNLDASLDRLHVAAADPQTNPAEVLIRFLDQQSPELIDDNMSALTVVRGEQP